MTAGVGCSQIVSQLHFLDRHPSYRKYCWSHKTLVTIHWIHLRVNGISARSKSFRREFVDFVFFCILSYIMDNNDDYKSS